MDKNVDVTHSPWWDSSDIQNQKTSSPEGTVSQEIAPPTVLLEAADRATTDIPPQESGPAVSSVDRLFLEHASDLHYMNRRKAVIGQGTPGPNPGMTLHTARRGSLGMPDRITLDAERASIAGGSRNRHRHDKPHHAIHLDDDPSHASAFRHSIAQYVNKKFSDDDKLAAPGREVGSKTSVIDAVLSAKWAQPPATPSGESQSDTSEEPGKWRPGSLLFYPHYVFHLIMRLLGRHSTAVRWLMFVLWVAYVAFALVYNFHLKKADYDWCHDGGLISWTSVIILMHLVVFKVIIPNADHICRLRNMMHIHAFEALKSIFSHRIVQIIAGILAAIIIMLITQVGHVIPDKEQWMAVCGYFVIILLAYLLSAEPAEIAWGVVAKNLLLQVLVVYLMMVWRLGRIVLQCIAAKIAFLFGFSQKAAWVLFAKDLPHMLSIELLSSLTLTGSIMHLLYYTGSLQGFLRKTGILLEFITGTTTVEAVSGALCTLFGGIETAVILEPYIVLLTMSELHTFITSGMASMTGVALAMYMDMGVEKITLMTVNFATFNGALAVSKIMYPETDTSVTTYRGLKFLDRDEYNMIDAAVRGAMAVLRLLAQLIAVLISFIAMVNMGNDFVEWLLENIGIPGMDVVGIMSLVLRPFIFLMGIEWQSTPRIARLLAMKTVLNEYFGYTALIKDSKQNPMQPRENAITVALLYGFSNLAHIGATVAYLTAVAPERRQDITGTVPRALLTAFLTNLLTAAIVGVLVSTHSQLHVTSPAQEAVNASIINALNGTSDASFKGTTVSVTALP